MDDDDDDEEDLYSRRGRVINQLRARTLSYTQEGQMHQSLYINEQLHGILTSGSQARSAITDLASFDTEWEIQYREGLEMDLIEHYIRRKNHYRAVFLLECIAIRVSHSYDPRNPLSDEDSILIERLVLMYELFIQRVTALELVDRKRKSRASIALTSILDRALKIDLEPLSIRLMDSLTMSVTGLSKDAIDYVVLRFAARNNACDLARRVLDRGADVDGSILGLSTEIRGPRNLTPLHAAVESESKDMVKLLVTNGADIEATTTDPLEETPLLMAVINDGDDSSEILMFLLDQRANIEARDGRGKTSLRRAIHWGSLEMVQILLKKGASVTATDNDGLTMLHWAAKGGRSDLLKMLLDCKADIRARDLEGRTALHLCCMAIDQPSDRIECIDVLIDGGIDVNQKDSKKETALHTASRKAPAEIVDHLLSRGAYHSAECTDGTPLHLVVKTFDCLKVRKLLEHGANPNMRRLSDGKTPLHLAALYDQESPKKLEVLNLLCTHGADVLMLDDHSMSAINYNKGYGPSTNVLRIHLPMYEESNGQF